MSACRGCGSDDTVVVLSLGRVPAADDFPPTSQPVSDDEISHTATMVLCSACGLAQLADDDTVTAEPKGVEPQALVDQAAAAVGDVSSAGLLTGHTVREFGSPHGGTWVPHLARYGFTEIEGGRADIVLDTFGIMHEPDQAAAFAERSAAVSPGGMLLLQFHSLDSIVGQGMWNALRHGHFAYYSMPALKRLLEDSGMSVARAWEYDLYGGTILVAATPESVEPDARVRAILEREAPMTDPKVVGRLQRRVDDHIGGLRAWLAAHRTAGRRVYAYGAASRAVAVLSLAGADTETVSAVADASPSKWGCRMPGTDIPIISPEELVAADPDVVLLMLPDLYPEVSRALAQLDGRWHIDGVEPMKSRDRREPEAT